MITVVEMAVADIVAARDAMWHSPGTDTDNFNTPEDYAEFSSSDDELSDAIEALKKFLGPTEEEEEAQEADRQSAKEWREHYERVAKELEAAKAKLVAYHKAVNALKGVEQ